MTDATNATRFEVRETGARLEITFSSVLAQIDRCDEVVADFVGRAEIALDLFALRILLREALLNAVMHGNGEDPTREVRLVVECLEDRARMTVLDQGPGFAWHDRDMEFDILGDGGRGLPLMQMYADEMQFNDIGNQVVLERRYETSPTAAKAQERK